MGWADLLGTGNPFQQFVAANRGKIGQFAAGLGTGQNLSAGLSAGASSMAQGQAADDAYATQQKADAERQRQIQDAAALKDKYVQFFTQQNQPQYAQAIGDGIMSPGDAYGDWMKAQAGGGADPTSDMQNYQYYANDEMKAGRSPMPFGQWVKGSAAPSAPSGYRATQDGNLAFIPGGPADPATTAPKAATDAQRRAGQLASVVDEDAALLLGDGSRPGAFEALADSGNQFWNIGAFGVNPMKGAASADYQRAQGAVENIAQSYLYAISGQAAPAGEVAKIVDSITPKPFENPAVLADKKRRLAEYVNAIQMAQQNPQTSGNAGDGWEVVGVQ